jgi:hypothetical protein
MEEVVAVDEKAGALQARAWEFPTRVWATLARSGGMRAWA